MVRSEILPSRRTAQEGAKGACRADRHAFGRRPCALRGTRQPKWLRYRCERRRRIVGQGSKPRKKPQEARRQLSSVKQLGWEREIQTAAGELLWRPEFSGRRKLFCPTLDCVSNLQYSRGYWRTS